MSEYNLPDLEDAPWLNLTKEEIEDLRKQKQELTEYGKEKIRKLMNKEPTHEEMLSIAERRELINEALEELNAIVLGGQNTREFYLSVSHIRNVLERLK
jgi:DNA-binding PadR family transcriptional regulator